jgi:hypothetical protein
MKKSPLKRSGFKKPRKKLKTERVWPIMPQELRDRLPRKCELCSTDWPLTPAHRHERWWYRKQPEKLWEYSQVMVLCTSKSIYHQKGCHTYVDVNKRLREDLFKERRGSERG